MLKYKYLSTEFIFLTTITFLTLFSCELSKDSVKKPPDILWEIANEMETKGNIERALESLEGLIDRFPEAVITAQAIAKRDSIRRSLTEEYEFMLRNVKVALTYTQSVAFLEKFQKKYPFYETKTVQNMIKIRLPKRESELEKERILKKTGIAIIDIETFWDKRVNLLSDLVLYVPNIEGTIRNESDKSIEKLKIRASFYDPDAKELFGDAWTFLISFSDAPLRPGYTKRLFLEGDYGYTYPIPSSLLRPLKADLFVEVDNAAKIKYMTIPIKQEYKYMQ